MTSSISASAEANSGFCDRFGQLIAALNLSQNEFARQLGSTSAFVSNMARGKSKPGLAFLQKIAETFDVSLDWLVLGKGTLRGDQHLDPEWHHALLLRVVLAQMAATGNIEARRLADELLGETVGNPSTTTARQALLDELAAKTSHGPLLASLYNQYLPVTNPSQRSKEALRAALQQLRPNSADPLASMVFTRDQTQSTQATGASKANVNQVVFGLGNHTVGGDHHER